MKIQNPEDGSIGEVTQRAFDQTWKRRGWTEVADDTRTTAQEVPPLVPLDAQGKPDLVALADANSIDSTGTKPELVERLRAAGLGG